ncbi:HNH endonuclease [Rhizobiaceae bacterium CRRU44]|uniref:HNH endonuclease n=2 Tax=Ferranicluibacter rubi TaxID=2715133 RepID=A0AA44CC62_9HYPH|nr:HNH endonuclease [Ferranicluibacter rubi]
MSAGRPSSRERGYTMKWEKARAVFLAQPGNQICRRCQAHGLLNAGNLRPNGSLQTNPKRMHLVVDHIVPHKQDQKLSWDHANWQPLCPDHHDITKQQKEHGKVRSGTGLDGRPLDPAHPWNQRPA